MPENLKKNNAAPKKRIAALENEQLESSNTLNKKENDIDTQLEMLIIEKKSLKSECLIWS